MPASKSKAANADADWDKLEEALLSPKVRGRPGTETSRTLEGFDDAELQVLRRLAMRSRVERSRSAPRGNVIFLHGITGADLAVADKRGRDDIWINFPRLIFGRINDLKLAAAGAERQIPDWRSSRRAVNKRYYARAIWRCVRAGMPALCVRLAQGHRRRLG